MYDYDNWYKCYAQDVLIQTLPTNDYRGDRSFTYAHCSRVVSELKTHLNSENSILTIVQKDKVVATLTSVAEFDKWLNSEYK